MSRLKGHFQEHIAKYATIAVGILTPLAGLLGLAAANLGGADSKAGHVALGGAAALGTAVAGIQYIKNLGIWQMLDRFGIAPGVLAAGLSSPSNPAPVTALPALPEGVTLPPGITPEMAAAFLHGADEPGDSFDGLPHHAVTDPSVVPADNVDVPPNHPVRS